MNFYLDLRNPTPIPRIISNGYTTPRQTADVIQGMERHQTRYILWSYAEIDPIPEWESPPDAHLGPLRDDIHNHYALTKVLKGPDGMDEVWERFAQ